MTATVFPIDRDVISEIEFPESTDHGRTWLAPYAIPHAVSLDTARDGTSLIAFAYHGEDEPAGPAHPLDSANDPAISISVAASTRKVLSLLAAARLAIPDFRRIADRLDSAASKLQRPTERMSYRLSAAALRLSSPLPPTPKQTVLRFVLEAVNPMEVFARFRPDGRFVLNRTTWRGKEPRSCAVTSIHSRPLPFGGGGPAHLFDLAVTYRPKGTITFTGVTRYDGWTAMMLDRAQDGTLLDGKGGQLPPDQPPVYLPFEMYPDAEFNELDFGEFQGEFEVEGINSTARVQMTHLCRCFLWDLAA